MIYYSTEDLLNATMSIGMGTCGGLEIPYMLWLECHYPDMDTSIGAKTTLIDEYGNTLNTQLLWNAFCED